MLLRLNFSFSEANHRVIRRPFPPTPPLRSTPSRFTLSIDPQFGSTLYPRYKGEKNAARIPFVRGIRSLTKKREDATIIPRDQFAPHYPSFLFATPRVRGRRNSDVCTSFLYPVEEFSPARFRKFVPARFEWLAEVESVSQQWRSI